MPTMRTDNEVKAFADGYKLCYQQFTDLLYDGITIEEILGKMKIGLTAVNAAVEVIDANPQKDTSTDNDDSCRLHSDRDGIYIEDYRDQYL